MGIKFQITPASQLQKPSSGKRGRPVGSKLSATVAQQKRSLTTLEKPTKRTSTVVLTEYGDRLFEPVMVREKPIDVTFVEYFSEDDCRFSKDGFFAIKYFQHERRCYLIYFINPITPTRDTTLATACLEAIEYKTWEFEDEDEYKQACHASDKEIALKLRHKSAFGKVVRQVIEVLRDLIVAEKFLRKQKEIARQEKEWHTFLVERDKKKQEEEDELERSDKDSNIVECIGEAPNERAEGEEGEEVLQQEGEEEERDDVPEVKEQQTVIVQGKKFVKLNWGGK